MSGHEGRGVVMVGTLHTMYRAVCSCGWEGEPKFYRSNADHQFGRHLDLVVAHPEITTWEPEP